MYPSESFVALPPRSRRRIVKRETHSLEGDFDCFLLNTPEAEDKAILDTLWTAVNEIGGTWRQSSLWTRHYNDITEFNRFLAECELPRAPAKKPIQIIKSLAKTADAVVSHFDWTAVHVLV